VVGDLDPLAVVVYKGRRLEHAQKLVISFLSKEKRGLAIG